MTIISTTVGKKPLEKNEVALIVNEKLWNAVLGFNLKWQNDLSSSPRKTIQYHSNPSLCSNHQCQRSWSWIFYEDPQDFTELTPKKKCPFHHRELWCKSRKSRDTWSNRQIWPWSTKWSRAKANRILPREHTGQRTYPLPTIQDQTLYMGISRWSI